MPSSRSSWLASTASMASSLTASMKPRPNTAGPMRVLMNKRASSPGTMAVVAPASTKGRTVTPSAGTVTVPSSSRSTIFSTKPGPLASPSWQRTQLVRM